MAQGQKLGSMNPVVYDIMLWVLSVVVDLFFREIHPRGAWRIPRKGPAIIIAAPHANQFVDPLIMMRVARIEAHRRISFLIAEKSMKRAFVGFCAKLVGAVPVGRALDKTKAAKGKVYLPDPAGNPLLLRGVGTDFTGKDFMVGGTIALPAVGGGSGSSAEIAEIVSPEEVKLKKPFKGTTALKQLTGREDADQVPPEELSHRPQGFEGSAFKIAPKVDQTEVYNAVYDLLRRGGCIGMYPEGGSHDRTELLPLKPGVALMALGALAENPDCGLKLIPCGMNYFHAHKFRSRAVIEFGSPMEVPIELVEQFKTGDRREAIGKLLDIIHQALVAVTVTSPDYDTLMLIQTVRRLYNPKGKRLPLPMVVELNRRLVKGYTKYKDDPRIISLKQSVLEYQKQLKQLNIRDHQVEYAKLSIVKVVATLIYRVGKLLLLTLGVLPGLIMFAPVFIIGKWLSIKKSREALAASTVKLQGRDVIATWKLLISMALAPALYTIYVSIFTWWAWHNNMGGYWPDFLSRWFIPGFGYVIFPTITFAALRFGEVAMDIFKSLRPLALALNPGTSNSLVKLRERRVALVAEVTELINTLGPEMFPDFDAHRIVSEKDTASPPASPTGRGRQVSEHYSFPSEPTSPTTEREPHYNDAGLGGGSSASGHLPKNHSFKNLADVAIFATRPATPSRSRSRTNSGAFNHGFSHINTKESFDEVSRKIRGAMRERGQRRKSESDWSSNPSGASTPRSERDPHDGHVGGFGGLGMAMTPVEGKKER